MKRSELIEQVRNLRTRTRQLESCLRHQRLDTHPHDNQAIHWFLIAKLTEGATQVSSASQSLAEGATEQAAGLEETSTSLEEMSSMTKQNADNAQQANTLASEARQSADSGTHAMQRMNSAIQEIDQVNGSVSQMDKVTQQNAANAEESASASEELNTQAVVLNRTVLELVTLVGGNGNQDNRSSTQDTAKESTFSNSDRVFHAIAQDQNRPRQLAQTTAKAKVPVEAIPLDDDFGEFNSEMIYW